MCINRNNLGFLMAFAKKNIFDSHSDTLVKIEPRVEQRETFVMTITLGILQ